MLYGRVPESQPRRKRPSPTSSIRVSISQVKPFLPAWTEMERDRKGREAVIFRTFQKREMFLFSGKGRDLQRGFPLYRNNSPESKPSSRFTVGWRGCDFSGVLKKKLPPQSSLRMVGREGGRILPWVAIVFLFLGHFLNKFSVIISHYK